MTTQPEAPDRTVNYCTATGQSRKDLCSTTAVTVLTGSPWEENCDRTVMTETFEITDMKRRQWHDLDERIAVWGQPRQSNHGRTAVTEQRGKGQTCPDIHSRTDKQSNDRTDVTRQRDETAIKVVRAAGTWHPWQDRIDRKAVNRPTMLEQLRKYKTTMRAQTPHCRTYWINETFQY